MAIQWKIAVKVVLIAALLAYISAPTFPYHRQMWSTSSNVTSLFVFGDDTVDCRVNLWRMSDGHSLADLVAEHFHLPYMPPHFEQGHLARYTKYGVNFASSACGIHNMTKPCPAWKCKSLWSQVEAFREYVKKSYYWPKLDLDKSVALISIGQNDFFYSLDADARFPVDDLIDDLKRCLQELVIGGLKKMVITNLPPLGCYPTLRVQSECNNFTNSLVEYYNAKLIYMVEELKQHPSSRGFENLSIRFVDLYSVVREVIERPGAVGVKYVRHPCCEPVSGKCVDSSVICEDKTEYVFFDNFHLTERMYELAFLHMKLSAPLR